MTKIPTPPRTATAWTAFAMAAALASAAGAAAVDEPVRLPPDTETSVNNIGVACTGISEAVRDETRWRAYPLKLEFADTHGHLVATEHVAVADQKGRLLLNLRCGGSWLLLKLPAGRDFLVSARLAKTTIITQAVAHVPKTGQKTVVLVFKDTP